MCVRVRASERVCVRARVLREEEGDIEIRRENQGDDQARPPGEAIIKDTRGGAGSSHDGTQSAHAVGEQFADRHGRLPQPATGRPSIATLPPPPPSSLLSQSVGWEARPTVAALFPPPIPLAALFPPPFPSLLPDSERWGGGIGWRGWGEALGMNWAKVLGVEVGGEALEP